ncbi:MAG TPA: histidine kinase [Hanamia sp.]
MLFKSIFANQFVSFCLQTSLKKQVMRGLCKSLLLILLVFTAMYSQAQTKSRDEYVPFDRIEWFNIVTYSYHDSADKKIALLTAIPFNGIDEVHDNKTPDIFYTSSYYKYVSNRNYHFQKLDTYVSGDVYFLAPRIFRENADSFEFRVLKDGQTVIKPWGPITEFADSNYQSNLFQKFSGYLGGYSTTWDHFITVQLRRKNNATSVAESSVYWKRIYPRIEDIYTSADLNEFLARLKDYYITPSNESKPKNFTAEYANKDDSIDHRPKTFVFEPGESNIIFYLNASIYWRNALEYTLIKNSKTIVDWKANDYDNNFIWLHNLEHGDYKIMMRFAVQRNDVSTYLFEIKPFWYQSKTFKAVWIALTILLLLFIILFITNRRKLRLQKAKAEKLLLEQRSVRSQLNPHFTFNAMSSVQSLMNQNKIEEANYYFTEFSTLLRDSMRNNEKEMHPLSIELKTVETYIKLEQLRFAFKYQIIIGDDVNTSALEIPALLLQPLIENAIKHGISQLQKEGSIVVSVNDRLKDLVISIQDNGKGFSPKEDSKGYGLLLTKERLQLFNQHNKKQNIEIKIESNNAGTNVLLTFKNWL